MPSINFKTMAVLAISTALVAAGCSSSNTDESGGAATSAQPVEPGGTATTGADTTTSPEAQPTAPTTIDSTPSSDTTAAGSNPIEYAFAGGWLLGGWDGDTWVDVVGPYDNPPQLPTPVRFVPLDGIETSSDDYSLTATCDWLEEDQNLLPYAVDFDNEFSEIDSPVGSTANWPLQPRPVELVEDTSAYTQQVNDFLLTLDVTDQTANIINVWRADFRGDGNTEVVIEARKTEGDNLINQAPGNYSVVLIVSDETDDLPVGLYVDGIATNAEPVSAEESDYGYQIYASKPIGFADLNGDGQMEIVLADWGWESSGVRVYEHTNGAYQVVLDKGCGV